MNFKKIVSKITTWFIIIVCSLLFACRGMFFNIETTYNQNLKLAPYDALIVPGIPFENNNWNYVMRSRVLWSVFLYREGYVKNIIYSGSAVYSPYVESKIMAMYAEKLGVPGEHIYVETTAEHSTENVYYSCLIAKKNGFQTVALATDKFQSRTLADFLPKIRRKTNMDVRSLPIQDQWLDTVKQNDLQIDYELARVDSFVSIVDRESKLKRLWGTLGKHIKYENGSEPEVQSGKTNSTN